MQLTAFLASLLLFLRPFYAHNLHFAPFSLSIWLPTHHFFAPNYLHLATKTPLFNGHFALFSYVCHGSNSFYLYN